MGGRGQRSAGGGAGGGGGGAFTVTQNPNGTVTITPNPNPQAVPSGGSGVSDVNTHTTYFTPADRAIVGPDNTDGFAIAQRSGKYVPVGYYQTGYYSNVNSELRSGRVTQKTQKVVDAMDRNMRPLNAPMDTVRWTGMDTIRAHLGLGRNATKQDVVNALNGKSASVLKKDFTSSSWEPKANALAGEAGRDVKIDMHYAKGALGQFSPTRKEGEFVGARNKTQRYENPRIERTLVTNTRGRRTYMDILVVDCYIDD